MKSKSNSFHLEIQTHGRNPYGVIRTSYRENGKVKHKNLCRLTGVSLDHLKIIRAALQNNAVTKDEFKITSSIEYGASFACASILKELELNKAIHSKPEQEWVKSACAMIIGRLVDTGSKLALSKCGAYSALWEICGISGEIDVDEHCYDVMDRLYSRQQAIQKTLAKKHLKNGTLVLYDITSCYMEGEYKDSEIVAHGYNRDKKRGHAQIVISLLCNKEGCPIAVEVLKGNTKDETTVLDKIDEIHSKYGIEKIIFVGDRGVVTEAKYKDINHDLVKVVTALCHGSIQKLLGKGTIQLSLFDENNIVEVIDDNQRYMLCKNPIMEKKEAETRKRLIEKTTEELDKIIKSTRKTKNSKEVRVGKIVNKYKMGKFIVFEGKNENFAYKLDQEKIERESALDGCYIVFTDVPKEDMTAIEAVKTYKSLIQVEQAFRNIKTAALEIRPIYHKTDDRIKCHAFICMLAYYVMWHMNQRLQPLFESGGVGKNREYNFEFVIKILGAIRMETVDFLGAKAKITTTPNEEQSKILKLLGVAI